MGDVQLSKEFEKVKTELFGLRFAQIVSSFEGHDRTKIMRCDITRIYAIARERELGCRTTPSIEE